MATPGEIVYALYDEGPDELHPEFLVGVLIGIYSTDALAVGAMKRAQERATKRGGLHEFTIDPMELDETNWAEGYVTEYST